MKKVLLHICCGPCAIMPLEILRREGYKVSGFFYNPNIQPWKEFIERYKAVKVFSKAEDLELIGEVKYEPETHLRAVVQIEGNRCSICYSLRLERTGQVANEEGFDAFTSTLLASPQQKFDRIVEIGERIGASRGTEFLKRDFGTSYSEGIKRSKEMGLYRQRYCGCVYSEKERYERDIARELG